MRFAFDVKVKQIAKIAIKIAELYFMYFMTIFL